tara:strand:- start:80 stop:343 length:264 start_codon:yes stop_codon:yes gene_type:complete
VGAIMKKIIQIFIITLGLMHNFAAADSLGSNQINEVFSEGKIINKMTVKDFMGVYYHIVHNDKFHLCTMWNKSSQRKPEINCYNLDD